MWVCPDSQEVFLRFSHQLNHVPYFCIDVPDDVHKYINDNPRLRPNQVSLSLLLSIRVSWLISFKLWTEILKEHKNPQFSYRSIYYLWAKQHQSEWKRHKNELESTCILLNEYSQEAPGEPYHIQNVLMPKNASDGFTAIAFVTWESLRDSYGLRM